MSSTETTILDPWVVNYTTLITEEEKNYQCENYDLFMGFFVKATIVILGCIGNSLTVYVLWEERNKSGTAYLLVALAFADTSVLIVWGWMDGMPALLVNEKVLPQLERVWGYFSAYMWALGSITHLLSTWLVTLVTVLRYVSVAWPLQAGQWTSVARVKWLTFICVIGSIVFYLPRCFEYGVTYDNSEGKYIREKRKWASGTIYNLTYKVIIYYLFIYVIPLSLLIFCTYKLVKILRESRKRKEKMLSASAISKDMDFTVSLIVVVVIFIICQLFNPIRRFLYDYFLERPQTKCPYFYHYFYLISGNILMFNSAVNFVCYFLSAPGFKKRFWSKLSCCKINKCLKRRTDPNIQNLSLSTHEQVSTA